MLLSIFSIRLSVIMIKFWILQMLEHCIPDDISMLYFLLTFLSAKQIAISLWTLLVLVCLRGKWKNFYFRPQQCTKIQSFI
jgi:hypothetical protein